MQRNSLEGEIIMIGVNPLEMPPNHLFRTTFTFPTMLLLH